VRWRRLASVALAAAPLAALPFACSSPETLLGEGSRCFVTTDCEPGLFCVPQKGGAGVCSNNFDAIVSTEPVPGADAAAPAKDAAVATEGGAAGDAPPITEAESDGLAEVTTAPLHDSSTPADASLTADAMSTHDAGSVKEAAPPEEAAAAGPEASSPDAPSG
jgi:hypothetical protein